MHNSNAELIATVHRDKVFRITSPKRVVEGEHAARSHPLTTLMNPFQPSRSRITATIFPRVPPGGGGGGGALGLELEPPCGPPSEATATVGIANTSNAIRHRLDTETLSFFISRLLLFSPR